MFHVGGVGKNFQKKVCVLSFNFPQSQGLQDWHLLFKFPPLCPSSSPSFLLKALFQKYTHNKSLFREKQLQVNVFAYQNALLLHTTFSTRIYQGVNNISSIKF